MAVEEHPTDEQLAAYLCRDGDEPELAEVVEHVEGCHVCRDLLDEVDHGREAFPEESWRARRDDVVHTLQAKWRSLTALENADAGDSAAAPGILERCRAWLDDFGAKCEVAIRVGLGGAGTQTLPQLATTGLAVMLGVRAVQAIRGTDDTPARPPESDAAGRPQLTLAIRSHKHGVTVSSDEAWPSGVREPVVLLVPEAPGSPARVCQARVDESRRLHAEFKPAPDGDFLILLEPLGDPPKSDGAAS